MFDLIGEDVDIRLTKATVEMFFHGSRVASHPRSSNELRDPIIQPEHMPLQHRKYLTYNADEFIRWARSIGRYTTDVVNCFLSSEREPDCFKHLPYTCQRPRYHTWCCLFPEKGWTVMVNQSTIDSLKAMKLSAMALELERQLEDAGITG